MDYLCRTDTKDSVPSIKVGTYQTYLFLKDQLIGVDIMLFGKLIKVLSEISKDGEEIKANVFNDIIDNLFQDNFIDDSELDEDDEDTEED